MHGEKSSAATAVANDWVTKVLPTYLSEYVEDFIYNADESALLYKALSTSTLANRKDTPSGEKNAKGNVINFIYHEHKWNGQTYLLHWQHQAGFSTSKHYIHSIQPLDQGIIRSFKAHYRRAIISKQLLHLECGLSVKDFSKKVDNLKALNMVKRAWLNVTLECIRNCFRKSGFTISTDVATVEESDVILDALDDDEINHLIEIDEDVPCCEDLTDNDIIDEITGFEEENSENESDSHTIKPSVSEALKSITILNNFFTDNTKVRKQLDDIEDTLCQHILSKMAQTRIKDYFQNITL
ncbi:uncharacterized protein LOC131997998 [Stomoxys calcitrans]|uniref:uncharacterized protein LOC131997998 n=1 Tax=Stomoxys calcitrans TaxID=35570 RepID=UPI0027E29291|nr:uncharacterized protein LOC131997998 [Stomoxys calcitrans]